MPHSLGEVDITKQKIQENPIVLYADSIDEAKEQVDQTVGLTAAPEFIEELHRHNILKHNKRFWGIPIELGEVDLTRKEQFNHPSIVSTDSLDDLKNKIKTVAGWSAPPEFIEELNGYNLIKYKNRFYGIPHELGEVSQTQK